MNTNVKKMCGLAVLTALYVVLSSFLKIPLVGNIMIDLGYIAFAVALCRYNAWGAIVGVVGCSLESLLFSAYGFSISWAIANLIIGIGCGLVFYFVKNNIVRNISIIFFSGLGLLLAKTIIECKLYSIPFEVKIAKNFVAFAVDTIVMLIGINFYHIIKKRIERG